MDEEQMSTSAKLFYFVRHFPSRLLTWVPTHPEAGILITEPKVYAFVFEYFRMRLSVCMSVHQDLCITEEQLIRGRRMTPFAYFLYMCHDDINVSNFFLTMGTPPNAKDDKGMTLLHYAAEGGAINTAKLLLSLPGVREECDQLGTTPLDLAVKSNHVEMMQLFDKYALNLKQLCSEIQSALALSRPSIRASYECLVSDLIRHILLVGSDDFLNKHRINLILYEELLQTSVSDRIREIYEEMFFSNNFRFDVAKSSQAIRYNLQINAALILPKNDISSPFPIVRPLQLPMMESPDFDYIQTCESNECYCFRIVSIPEGKPPPPLCIRRGLVHASHRNHRPHANARISCIDKYKSYTDQQSDDGCSNFPKDANPRDQIASCSLSVTAMLHTVKHDEAFVSIAPGHTLLLDFGIFSKATLSASFAVVATLDGGQASYVIECSEVPNQNDSLTGAPFYDEHRIWWQPVAWHNAASFGATPSQIPSMERRFPETIFVESDDQHSNIPLAKPAIVTLLANSEDKTVDSENIPWMETAHQFCRSTAGCRYVRIRPFQMKQPMLLKQFDVFGQLKYCSLHN
eukprot:gene136-3526_t